MKPMFAYVFSIIFIHQQMSSLPKSGFVAKRTSDLPLPPLAQKLGKKKTCQFRAKP